MSILTRLRSGFREAGATAVEYSLMVGLIATVIILAVAFLGGNLNGLFTSAGSSI